MNATCCVCCSGHKWILYIYVSSCIYTCISRTLVHISSLFLSVAFFVCRLFLWCAEYQREKYCNIDWNVRAKGKPLNIILCIIVVPAILFPFSIIRPLLLWTQEILAGWPIQWWKKYCRGNNHFTLTYIVASLCECTGMASSSRRVFCTWWTGNHPCHC